MSQHTPERMAELDDLAISFKGTAYQMLLYKASEENWDRTQYNEAVRKVPAEVTLYFDYQGYIVAAICGMLFKETAHYNATDYAYVWEWNGGHVKHSIHKSFGPNWRGVEARLRKLVDTADDEIGEIVYLSLGTKQDAYVIDETR